MRINNLLKACKPNHQEKKYRHNFAVILVDMQVKFVKELRRGESRRIIPNQLQVLKLCNQTLIPVIVLELKTTRYGETIKKLMFEAKKNIFFKLIKKEYDDGFTNTDLDSYLKSLGVKLLLIMGINADYCVKATANSAIYNGYKIVTSNEVISGQAHHRIDNSISWFETNGCCVNSLDELSKVLSI